ncbi:MULTISPECIES: hypothetical protein [Oceanobacillus]|uniref:Uncharacterized protein n=1 Tax=Oceanobacillus indicireducens TaxID=1004261 RepID=A0A917XZH9_9BACI|nr:hypothetical protein [Oceanobacillus indicireducens]GGN61020.1 hypothetical protein GCM10007971_25650 [Oceanobacillus indicireducens]
MKKYILNSTVGILCGTVIGFFLYGFLTKEQSEWSILIGLILGTVIAALVSRIYFKRLYSK